MWWAKARKALRLGCQFLTALTDIFLLMSVSFDHNSFHICFLFIASTLYVARVHCTARSRSYYAIKAKSQIGLIAAFSWIEGSGCGRGAEAPSENPHKPEQKTLIPLRKNWRPSTFLKNIRVCICGFIWLLIVQSLERKAEWKRTLCYNHFSLWGDRVRHTSAKRHKTWQTQYIAT